MNKSIPIYRFAAASCLTALSLFACLPAAVLADQNAQLLSQNAAMDDSVPVAKPAEPTTAAPDASRKFELSAKKLTSGSDMTREDFRDLGIGTLGVSATQRGNERYPRVDAVFAGSPAEAAGIEVGDIILSNDSLPAEVPGSWNQESWKFHFDHVGTQSVLTVKHHKETRTITLTRMNIEDLPDPKVRRLYEEQALKLGSAGVGTILTTTRPDMP